MLAQTCWPFRSARNVPDRQATWAEGLARGSSSHGRAWCPAPTLTPVRQKLVGWTGVRVSGGVNWGTGHLGLDVGFGEWLKLGLWVEGGEVWEGARRF